jgi:recombination protein RecA
MPSRWARKTATDAAIAKFEKDFASTGIELTSADQLERPAVIPTGSLALDAALRIGGVPRGRIVELFGPEHAGKSTLADMIVASAQRTYPDQRTAFVDAEHTFDAPWAAELGVDLPKLKIVDRPETAQDVADATKALLESGLYSVVVLDSVGAMISKRELEKDADEDTVAEIAKIMTRLVKQAATICHATETLLLVINQIRGNISATGRGPATKRTGGFALEHMGSIRLAVRRGSDLPKTVRVDGVDIPVKYPMVVKVEKNKLAPYGNVANLWLTNQATERWGPVGVDQPDEAATFGERVGAVERKGAFYTTSDGQRHQGREALLAHLRANPPLVAQIREAVIASLTGQLAEQPEPDPDPLGISRIEV